ncbi:MULTISPECIES: preprotein translocase subunit SecE [Olsenella]|uniref:preprotein translocase subunit SecE n=1 Tax=Olsenella TaxID=133925 RepID=UPI000782F172|nr:MULTISPECIES: preprotein translocase subunit SecE [Olsenella]KXB61728.1 preprotein translocase, SecE subunit [Olsenella sp. DNF00959]
MAKKERQKRSARQARQQERAEREAARASASAEDAKSTSKKSGQSSNLSSSKASKPAKAKKRSRLRSYLSDVKTEMRRVVWPSKPELKSYSVAVIVMLIVFGILVWLVDTGFVALLVGFTGLRG